MRGHAHQISISSLIVSLLQWDIATRRRKSLFANKYIAAVYGMSQEDFLRRVENNTQILCTSRLDWLVGFMEDILCFLHGISKVRSPSHTRACTQDSCCSVRCAWRVQFLKRATCASRTVSPMHYDRVRTRAHTPTQRLHRPLLALSPGPDSRCRCCSTSATIGQTTQIFPSSSWKCT